MTRLILATLLLVAGLLVVGVHAARATVVTGSFAGVATFVSDQPLGSDNSQFPVPLPVEEGNPMTGSFSYDTNLAVPGPAAGQFGFNAGAQLTVASEGVVAESATGAGFAFPITIKTSSDAFQLIGTAPLNTNPFGLTPELSLTCGTPSCLPNGVLPTSFSLADFSTADALWFSPAGGDPVARFHITALTVTAVPEPAQFGIALLGLALLGAGARRWRPLRAGGDATSTHADCC